MPLDRLATRPMKFITGQKERKESTQQATVTDSAAYAIIGQSKYATYLLHKRAVSVVITSITVAFLSLVTAVIMATVTVSIA